MPDEDGVSLIEVPDDADIQPPEAFEGWDAERTRPKTEQEALEARAQRDQQLEGH